MHGFHLKLLSENQYTERCISLQGGNERVPLFDTLFVPFWVIFGAVDAHKNLLSNYERRANWRSEIPTVIDRINELLLLLLLLLLLVVVVVVYMNYMTISFINTTNGLDM
jgi:hypothetical protein